MSYFRWTDERLALAAELAPTHTRAEAAPILGCNIDNFSSLKRHYGIQFRNPRKKASDHDVELIRQLSEEGMSNVELADKFELTPQHISRILHYWRRGTDEQRRYHQIAPHEAIKTRKEEKERNNELMREILLETRNIDEASRMMAEGGSGFKYWQKRYLKLIEDGECMI